VRSVSSVALHLLRMIEEMLLKGATHNLIVRTRSEVALYVLNHKRAHLRELESRFQIAITVNADATIGAAQPFLIEKGEQVHSVEAAKAIVAQAMPPAAAAQEEEEDLAVEEEAGEAEAESEGEEAEEQSAEAQDEAEGEPRRGRRRRRGRGGRGLREDESTPETAAEPAFADESNDDAATESKGGESESRGEQRGESEGERRRRRRGRRGGRRNRRGREGEDGYVAQNGNGEHYERQPREQHGAEPEVADAVADLGGPGQAEAPAEPAHPTPQPFEPVAREPEPVASAEPPAPAEPPRRRSTVREPAPIFSSGAMSDVQPASAPAPAPVPEPPVTMPEAAAEAPAEAKPRRFGWWNKRG
jgi:ribonuclease E